MLCSPSWSIYTDLKIKAKNTECKRTKLKFSHSQNEMVIHEIWRYFKRTTCAFERCAMWWIAKYNGAPHSSSLSSKHKSFLVANVHWRTFTYGFPLEWTLKFWPIPWQNSAITHPLHPLESMRTSSWLKLDKALGTRKQVANITPTVDCFTSCSWVRILCNVAWKSTLFTIIDAFCNNNVKKNKK